jgi:hypothetical protein
MSNKIKQTKFTMYCPIHLPISNTGRQQAMRSQKGHVHYGGRVEQRQEKPMVFLLILFQSIYSVLFLKIFRADEISV